MPVGPVYRVLSVSSESSIKGDVKRKHFSSRREGKVFLHPAPCDSSRLFFCRSVIRIHQDFKIPLHLLCVHSVVAEASKQRGVNHGSI